MQVEPVQDNALSVIPEVSNDEASQESLLQNIPEDKTLTDQDIMDILQVLKLSSGEKLKLEAVTLLKKSLVREQAQNLESLIEKIVAQGILGSLMDIIKSSQTFALKHTAIWCFINICCGNTTHITKVIDSGILEVSINIIQEALNSDAPTMELFELAIESVWMIGNIAGDGLAHRDACLELDAANLIVKFVYKHPDNEKLVDIAVWALYNLASFKPAPLRAQISEGLKLFLSIIEKDTSMEIKYHALWGLNALSSTKAVGEIVASGSVPTIINYLSSDANRLIFPALQILGNIISSTQDNLTDEIIKFPKFIQSLSKLCTCDNEKIRLYATWTVSNIAAGTPQQISKILEHPQFIQCIKDNIKEDDPKLKYQASCALANLVFRATISQIEELVVNHNYLDSLLEVMKQQDLKTYERNIIDPIESMLTNDTNGKIKPLFEKKGLIEQMRTIQYNLSHEMRYVANRVINHVSNPNSGVYTLFDTNANNNNVFGNNNFNRPVVNNTNIFAARPAVNNGNVLAARPATNIIPAPVQVVAQPVVNTVVNTAAVVVADASNNNNTDATPTKKQPKYKANKVGAAKKIKKAEPAKKVLGNNKKGPIRRTKSMAQTLREAKLFIGRMKKGARTRSSNRTSLAKNGSVENTPSKMIKRTHSMKQTLSEAKHILKQIASRTRSGQKGNN